MIGGEIKEQQMRVSIEEKVSERRER